MINLCKASKRNTLMRKLIGRRWKLAEKVAELRLTNYFLNYTNGRVNKTSMLFCEENKRLKAELSKFTKRNAMQNKFAKLMGGWSGLKAEWNARAMAKDLN